MKIKNVYKEIGLRIIKHKTHNKQIIFWEPSCDECVAQEEDGHYCLLHSIMIKNMDIKRCDDFEEQH